MSTDPNKPGNDSESESPTEKRGGQDTFAAAAAVARSDHNDQDNRPRRFRRTTALAAGVAIAVAVAVSYFAVSRDLRITFKREPRSKAGSGSTNGSKQPVNSVSTGTIAGPRVALVIGNGKYRFVPQLANPLNDARLIAKTCARRASTWSAVARNSTLISLAWRVRWRTSRGNSRALLWPSSITPDMACRSAAKTISSPRRLILSESPTSSSRWSTRR